MKNGNSKECVFCRWCVCVCLLAGAAGGGGEVRMLNWRRWGPLAGEAPVLLVLGDGRPLGALLQSVCAARGVQTCLLLVVHAGDDAAARQVVHAVRCCKVAQVVFPALPGGGGSTLHWWWAARWVFEAAPWARTHRGPVMFLRGGQLLAPDALHVLRRAGTLRGAHMVALGRPAAPRRPQSYDLVSLTAWRASFSVGLVLRRGTWNAVRRGSHAYCTAAAALGGTHWAGALQAALDAGLRGQSALMAAVAAPRVLRDDAHGRAALRRARAELFPARMRAVHVWGPGGRLLGPPPIGGQRGDSEGGQRADDETRRLCEGPLLFNNSLALA